MASSSRPSKMMPTCHLPHKGMDPLARPSGATLCHRPRLNPGEHDGLAAAVRYPACLFKAGCGQIWIPRFRRHWPADFHLVGHGGLVAWRSSGDADPVPLEIGSFAHVASSLTYV